MHQIGQRVGPKGPHRPQRGGEGAEEQHRAPQNAQHHKAPQLALRPAEEKGEGGGPHGQAVTPVQHPGEAGDAEAEGAQHVVQHAGGQAQQDGLGEHQ